MDNPIRQNGNEQAASLPSAQVAENDDSLALEVSHLLYTAIEHEHGAITLATPEHQQAIDLHLEGRGIDVSAARERRQYLSFDAAEMLTMISLKGVPDEEHFGVVLAAIVEPMCLRHERVTIFGEIVGLLRAQGRMTAAIGLERSWKELIRARPMLLYCAYPNEVLTDPRNALTLRQTCREQRRILGTRGLPLEAKFNGPVY